MTQFFHNKKLYLYLVIVLAVLCSLMAWWSTFAQLPTVTNTTDATSTPTAVATTTSPTPLFTYIEVTDGCDWEYIGQCVNMRSGPGVQYGVISKLRIGMVLKVGSTVTARDGSTWYKIALDKTVLYPERVSGAWYVSADVVQTVQNVGDVLLTAKSATTTKRIVVNISQEMLYAYDGTTLFMQEPISTGLEFTPTPLGTFVVFKKTPSRYMQGPVPGVSDQFYDLPGVPWDLYFTPEGDVIHGAYWHNHFGEPWSHGCVNLSVENAKKLYEWADIGTKVTVTP